MSHFESFITQLLYTKDYEAAFTVYKSYIESLDFHSVSYVFMPSVLSTEHKSTPPRFSLSKNFSKSFIEEYNEKGFQKYDYIVDAVNKGEEDRFYLWQQDRNSNKLTNQAKYIIDNAKHDHHMGNGCSILTRRSPHGIGAVSLIGDESDCLFERYIGEHRKTLYESTTIFNNFVMANAYEIDYFIMRSIFSSLNKTERKILKLLSEGKSVPFISTQLNKSQGHIENLVMKMRTKVGGVNADGKPAISKDKLIGHSNFMRINQELN